MMSEQDKCIPWYLPPVDPNVRLCSPFEARSFSNEMDKIQDDACQVLEVAQFNVVTSMMISSIKLKAEGRIAIA